MGKSAASHLFLDSHSDQGSEARIDTQETEGHGKPLCVQVAAGGGLAVQ